MAQPQMGRWPPYGPALEDRSGQIGQIAKMAERTGIGQCTGIDDVFPMNNCSHSKL